MDKARRREGMQGAQLNKLNLTPSSSKTQATFVCIMTSL